MKALAANDSILLRPRFRDGVSAPAIPGLGRPFADPALWIAMIPMVMGMPVALQRRKRIGVFPSHGDDAGHE